MGQPGCCAQYLEYFLNQNSYTDRTLWQQCCANGYRAGYPPDCCLTEDLEMKRIAQYDLFVKTMFLVVVVVVLIIYLVYRWRLLGIESGEDKDKKSK